MNDKMHSKTLEVKNALRHKLQETTVIKDAEIGLRCSQVNNLHHSISVTSKTCDKVKELASKRLEKVITHKEKLANVRDLLAEESHRHREIENMLSSQVSSMTKTISDLQERLATTAHPMEVVKTWTRFGCVGGTPTWSWRSVQMVLELLSHRTPPSCISANILTVASIINPQQTTVKELPSVNFIRECRSVLSHLTKTLAAYQLAKHPILSEIFNDGTNRRQTSIQNCILGYMSDNGFKTLTLSTSILPENESSAMIAQSILDTFKEGRELLKAWRETTQRMYPHLMDNIPLPCELDIGKLGKGGSSMMDTCNGAKKANELLTKAIEEAAAKMGWSAQEIKTYQLHCWHHLRNIWFGAVVNKLSLTLNDILEDSLNEVHPMLRVNTNPETLFRAGEYCICFIIYVIVPLPTSAPLFPTINKRYR